MHAWIEGMNAWSAIWADGMSRGLWQGGLALLAVALVCRLAPRIPAHAQCWLWRLAYVKLFIAVLGLAPVELPLLPSTTRGPQTQPQPMFASTGAVSALTSPVAAEGTAIPVTFAPVPEMGLLGWATLAWLAAVTGWGVRIRRQYRETHRVRASGTPVEDAAVLAQARELSYRLGLGATPEVLVTDQARGPFLVGVLRPAVVLPQVLLTDGDPEEVRLVLAHELGHLKRRDLPWTWLPTLAHGLFPFHPLVWWAQREWSVAVETACDELVLRETAAPPARYARMLLDTATRFGGDTQLRLTTVGVVGSCRSLRRRLQMMHYVRPMSRRRQRCTTAALVAVGALTLVPWRVVAAPSVPAEVVPAMPAVPSPAAVAAPGLPTPPRAPAIRAAKRARPVRPPAVPPVSSAPAIAPRPGSPLGVLPPQPTVEIAPPLAVGPRLVAPPLSVVPGPVSAAPAVPPTPRFESTPPQPAVSSPEPVPGFELPVERTRLRSPGTGAPRLSTPAAAAPLPAPTSPPPVVTPAVPSDDGVPVLKDIPLVGKLFRKSPTPPTAADPALPRAENRAFDKRSPRTAPDPDPLAVLERHGEAAGDSRVEVFALRHISVTDLQHLLQSESGLPGGIRRLAADVRTNSLVIQGSEAGLKNLKPAIRLLDVPMKVERGRFRITIVPVNVKADLLRVQLLELPGAQEAEVKMLMLESKTEGHALSLEGSNLWLRQAMALAARLEMGLGAPGKLGSYWKSKLGMRTDPAVASPFSDLAMRKGKSPLSSFKPQPQFDPFAREGVKYKLLNPNKEKPSKKVLPFLQKRKDGDPTTPEADKPSPRPGAELPTPESDFAPAVPAPAEPAR